MTDSRERFEEWAELFGLPLAAHPTAPEDCYMNRDATFAWQGWSARDSEVQRLREALAKINAATYSHVNGRDLFAELHPWFQGDWLSDLWHAIKDARELLPSQAKEPK